MRYCKRHGGPKGHLDCNCGPCPVCAQPEVVEEAMEPSERAKALAKANLFGNHDPEMCDCGEKLALAFEEYGREVRREFEPLLNALRTTNAHLLEGIRETQADYESPPEPADQWSYDASVHYTANRVLLDRYAAALRASPQGQAGEREGE